MTQRCYQPPANLRYVSVQLSCSFKAHEVSGSRACICRIISSKGSRERSCSRAHPASRSICARCRRPHEKLSALERYCRPSIVNTVPLKWQSAHRRECRLGRRPAPAASTEVDRFQSVVSPFVTRYRRHTHHLIRTVLSTS
ncbi:unnamed protein product [Acanthoscelides obtectus]|uniref:Uncharacterized protein n=1 Tax=Acanthoscelides obtectus TaxID=200917 RepID=A0A9P0L6F9_ACAOB|nr:unnamed protein product [Acanthoscelides obtectus]CAK1627730.1 hypothetical protein AOBTE_LOCUS4795 [Acanthoscelides obtectus]